MTSSTTKPAAADTIAYLVPMWEDRVKTIALREQDKPTPGQSIWIRGHVGRFFTNRAEAEAALRSRLSNRIMDARKTIERARMALEALDQ